jgi:pectin methylesterase-like acyl-CoA thioesterase
VTDVNEAPDVTTTTFNVWAGGQTVSLSATDPDDAVAPADVRYWSVVSAGNLSIDEYGALTVSVVEANSNATTGTAVSQTISATVADRSPGGLTDTQTITVSIKPFAVFNASNAQVGVYDTLQAAVDGALAGQTVKIAAGNYTLSSEVVINKGIQIVGVDSAATVGPDVVITNTAGSRNFVLQGNIAAQGGGDVTISGVKVVGGTEAVSVFGPNGGTMVDRLTVTNSEFVGQSNGSVIVDVQHASSDLASLTITNVKISQDNVVSSGTAKHQGIVAWGFDGDATITKVTIEGDMGVPSATATSPHYAILLQGSTGAYSPAGGLSAGAVT